MTTDTAGYAAPPALFLIDLLLILTCQNSFPKKIIRARGFRCGHEDLRKGRKEVKDNGLGRKRMERRGRRQLLIY